MKEKFLAFLSILPFFIVFTFFMIAPLIWIVFNAFYVEEDEIYSLANFIHIFESKFYLQSIINSLQISFISSIFWTFNRAFGELFFICFSSIKNM